MTDSKNNARLCNAQDSCLLIVDVQTRLTSAMPTKSVAWLRRNIAIMVQAADKLIIPVMLTAQYPKGLGPIETEIMELLTDKTQVFEKTSFSCTEAKGLLQELNKTGRKQIIITGVEAHICVLQSAMQLLLHGFQVFVIADAICSIHNKDYQLALKRMNSNNITVCTMGSVIFEWLRDSNHEYFKEIAQLLK